METTAPSRPEEGLRPGPKGLLRRIYTSNPFYVISAGLVFLGLRASFDARGPAVETGALMVGLTGYTLLLAATAVVLVRWARAWDDVRTVLLLVVLMFLATSVAFDETLASDPTRGRALFLGGFGVAVLVSEATLRGLRLTLRAGFRVPYHLMLGLFFVYPVGLSPLIDRPSDPALMWCLFAFSAVGGLVTLSLVPAIRRGPEYAAKSGSPWPWPLFPWVLFGLLGLAACVRAYSLCVSFHFVLERRSIFGPYFLVPLLMGGAVLLLELGMTARGKGPNRLVTSLALLAPFGLVLMAMAGHDRPDPVYQRFLWLFVDRLGGGPAWVSTLGLILFTGYAVRRGVPGAISAATASVATLAVVGPETIGVEDLGSPRPWPLLLSAGVQGVAALRRPDARRAFVALLLLILAATAAVPESWGSKERLILAYHLLVPMTLAFGLLSGPRGEAMRDVSLGLLGLGGLGWLAGPPGAFETAYGVGPIAAYPLVLAIVATVYGMFIGGAPFLRLAGCLAGGWSLVYGARTYLSLRRMIVGLDLIALGLGFFAFAALISLAKAGVLRPRPATGPVGDGESKR